MPGSDVCWSVAILAAASAAITDLWRFKIHNALTLPLLVLGLLYHGVAGGPGALGGSALGALTGFALLLPIYGVGGMGAGDVKLIAGLGAWLNPSATCEVILVSCLAAGFYACALLVRRRVARHAEHAGQDATQTGTLPEALNSPERRSRLIPFGALIALGVITAFVYGY